MLLEITVAIIFAKILSTIFEKIKQPGVIGEPGNRDEKTYPGPVAAAEKA